MRTNSRYARIDVEENRHSSNIVLDRVTNIAAKERTRFNRLPRLVRLSHARVARRFDAKVSRNSLGLEL